MYIRSPDYSDDLIQAASSLGNKKSAYPTSLPVPVPLLGWMCWYLFLSTVVVLELKTYKHMLHRDTLNQDYFLPLSTSEQGVLLLYLARSTQ